jgi:hypothetical protein
MTYKGVNLFDLGLAIEVSKTHIPLKRASILLGVCSISTFSLFFPVFGKLYKTRHNGQTIFAFTVHHAAS